MTPRRLSRKDIGELLDELPKGGWRVEEPVGRSNVYKAKCSCGRHIEHIHSTPSNPNYAKNKLAHMKRQCWKEQ